MFQKRSAHHLNLSIGPNKFQKRSAHHMNLSIEPNMFQRRTAHHMNLIIEPNTVCFKKDQLIIWILSIQPNMFLDSVRPGECGEISGDAGGRALAGDHGEDQARPERGHARLRRRPLPPRSSRGVPHQARAVNHLGLVYDVLSTVLWIRIILVSWIRIRICIKIY